ncbi:MAG: isoprenylcysteine carboxylmethyltransferase family protein [Gemmatimonadales bacterium]
MRPTASDSNFSLLIPSHPAPSILHGSPQNAGYSSEVVLTKAFSTRHWSDWAGTAAFAALAVGLWHQAPEFGVLILPGLLQELLVAVSFLLRGRAQVGAPSRAARLVAYANSFLVMGFILLSARFQPDWLRPTPHDGLRQVGAVIWLAAATLSLWPLWHLRRAFSLEPAARVLVTAGPYRLARHPIYAIYILINLGILLRHLTLPFAAVIAAWMALLVVRVRYEERVLSVAFPEYRDYRRRVRAFGILG